jgi:hypothetical protein
MPHHTFSARCYPRNSPHAAGRIVALALLSNGEVKPSEWAELESRRVHHQLGLTAEEWRDVVGDLYLHLVGTGGALAGRLTDARLIGRLLAEVDDAALQRRVLHLCAAVIHADHQIDEGESAVLRAVLDHWELRPEEHELVEPVLYGLDFQVTPRRTHQP